MVISIGFGKNAQGTLSHNFGPINQDGGERRLNVLVTRARHQVIVVSSIRAGDIDLSRTQKLGPRLLKNYLDFAERGPIALQAAATDTGGEYESPFEEQVGEALERAGFIVHRQVGCSKFRIDLAVVDPRQPGRYVLGIECDGESYHRSKTARDRDRLRQEILEGLGWEIHRIWSKEWIQQRERELDRVIERVNKLLQDQESIESDSAEDDLNGPPASVGYASSVDESVHLSSLSERERQVYSAQTIAEDHNALAAPYRVVDHRNIGDADILAAPLAQIADAVAICVEVEGPIHRELVIRRIATAWGYRRAGARIAARIDAAISAAVRQGDVRQQGTFLWPPGNLEVVPRCPATDGIPRAIAHIADEEIEVGMTLLLGHAFSMTADELTVQASRLYGYQRTGSDINRRMREVLQRAVESGSIVVQGELYRLPRK